MCAKIEYYPHPCKYFFLNYVKPTYIYYYKVRFDNKMKQNIRESELRNRVVSIIRESQGIQSEEDWYVRVMAQRLHSWMEDAYEDYGGIDAVSPEAMTDFSNRNEYDESLNSFAREFNVDREYLRPLMNKALEVAHNQLKQELTQHPMESRNRKNKNSKLSESVTFAMKKAINERVVKKNTNEGYVPSDFPGNARDEQTGGMISVQDLKKFVQDYENGAYKGYPALFQKMYQDAKQFFENNPMSEGVVDKFTPYTEKEREQNFIPFTAKDKRTPFQKNPSYEKALRAAQERQKLMKQGGSVSEDSMHFGAERNASDNNYKETWRKKYAEQALAQADSAIQNSTGRDVSQVTAAYKQLMSLYNCKPIKYDVRLQDVQNEIYHKINELIRFVQTRLSRNEGVDAKKILREWDYGGSNGDAEEEWAIQRMCKNLYDAENSLKSALEGTYDSRNHYSQTGEYMYEGGKDELYGIYKELCQYISKFEESNSFYLD